MASPQVENGYTRIANELLEAIVRARFTSYELGVLLFIIRETYGYGVKFKQLALSYIAKGTKIDRSNVAKAKARLVARKVVLNPHQEGQELLGIQKDWEKWGGVESTPPSVKSTTKAGVKSTPSSTKKGPTKEKLLATPAGPPKPPEEHHQDFHRLSWGFYEKRKELFADQHFNPWDGRNLKLCKQILEARAHGDLAEVRRRFKALCDLAKADAKGYWHLTPGDLSAKWDQLKEATAKASTAQTQYARLP